ncbi:MAG: hypothetical protein QXR45_14075 [Candidatus Bathyarchaeia archaeon]
MRRCTLTSGFTKHKRHHEVIIPEEVKVEVVDKVKCWVKETLIG